MANPAQGARYRGSVRDFPDFDAGQDAEALYSAMKGFGSDKEAILELITSRSNRQRQDICQSYKSLYGKDLIADLKYELTGKFERLIVGLMRPLAYWDAKEIKDAIAGAGTDEKCLIEILASRTNEQMHQLVAAYKDAYERDLEADIIGDTSGHFQKMLVVLLQVGPGPAPPAECPCFLQLKGTVRAAEDFSPDADAKALRKAMKGLGEAGAQPRAGAPLAQGVGRGRGPRGAAWQTGPPVQTPQRAERRGPGGRACPAGSATGRWVPSTGRVSACLCHPQAGRAALPGTPLGPGEHTRGPQPWSPPQEPGCCPGPGPTSHVERRSCGRGGAGQAEAAWQGLPGLVAAPSCACAPAAPRDLQGAGTDEQTLIEILATRSNAEIQAINEAYKEGEWGRGQGTPGARGQALSHSRTGLGAGGCPTDPRLPAVQSVRNKPLFFADKLYQAMKGAGTDEKTLTRVMVSRSEVDLLNIRREFVEKYDKSLHQAIEGDTSGDFLKALLAICGGED
ncbi:PREDICTED: annexin A6-like [Condylura cristata]|uniref:annexin A6-like n=1 Tax=Condylura cristata TaxID=143302 RepID=UPI0006428E50|nr:PREDICTED: annexin A6-like [Condylura cristata]